MNTTPADLPLNGGTEQRDRIMPPLGEALFAVDGLTLDQRIQLSAGLAQRLRFIDLHNRPLRTWSRLFDSDETFVLAAIASTDRWPLQAEFLRIADVAPLEALAHQVLKLARQLDKALFALTGSPLPAAQRVAEVLEQRVKQQLAAQMQWLRAGRSFSARMERWAPDHPAWYDTAAPGTDLMLEQGERAALRGVFFSLLSTLHRVQVLAREQLPQTLDSGLHEPAPGLLITFLRLFESVQARINRFADRHVDFYYHEVLGLHARAAVPDETFVACLRDSRAEAKVQVPAGTRFAAGKGADGEPILFQAQHALAVGDARVAALATLRLQRDARIAPEAELGYVSSVRSAWLGLPAATAAPVPLFGGGVPSVEAAIGLAVASPLLWMKEGERRVELTLQLDWPGQTLATRLQAVLAARTQADFATALGLLFGQWILSRGPGLTAADRQRLRDGAAALGLPSPEALESRLRLGPPRALLCDEPVDDVLKGYDPRELAFFHHAGDLFELELTHAGGWWRADRVQVARPDDGRPGLKLSALLRPEDPPITGCDAALHGATWGTALPLLRLTASPRARVHPYSLLDPAVLVQAALVVDVQGVQDMVLSNQLGPLDGSKPFAPFGPLPSTSSYLVFGAPEAAAKPLQQLRVHLAWGGLPQEAGGFETLYRGYGAEWRARPAPRAANGREQWQGPFSVQVALLRDGQWQHCGGASAAQPLFAAHDLQAAVPATQVFEIDESSLRQHARPSSTPLEAGAVARNGLVKLQLNGPPGAFGHAAYGPLLSEALSSRSRRRGHLPMPPTPYTPVLEGVRVDYRAATVLRPTRGSNAADDAPRLLHIHPFGISELRLDGEPEPRNGQASTRPGPLPHLGLDGSLVIGVEAAANPWLQPGPLRLLFQLHEEGAAEGLDGSVLPAPVWHCLVQDRWRALPPSSVLADSTLGLLRSGVVELSLPEDFNSDNQRLGTGLFWLRVSLRSGHARVAPLVTVHAQALGLARVLGSDSSGLARNGTVLPADHITGPDVALPGLAAVLQPEASSGGRAAEDECQMRVRAGERLRHKNRGSLAWDVERLVLEHFPEVFKACCFSPGEAGLAPGGVLLVLVPHVRRNDAAAATLAPRLDAALLERVRAFLAARMSAFARLQVRNAAYERVQVRCPVRLAPRAQPGAVLRRINQALVEYISPWFDGGLGPSFRWSLRNEELRSLVRHLPGVAEVGALSMLRVVHEDSGLYRLSDTAAMRAEGSGATPGPAQASDVMGHAHPWSLALPLAQHLVERVDDDALQLSREQSRTGLRRLRVGGTLILRSDPTSAPASGQAPAQSSMQKAG